MGSTLKLKVSGFFSDFSRHEKSKSLLIIIDQIKQKLVTSWFDEKFCSYIQSNIKNIFL